jgi:hypothetical protein
LKVKFLLDENLPHRLKIALLRLNSQIDILRVGEPGAPAIGTLDPEILIYLSRKRANNGEGGLEIVTASQKSD